MSALEMVNDLEVFVKAAKKLELMREEIASLDQNCIIAKSLQAKYQASRKKFQVESGSPPFPKM
jgi:hypothetical protein